MATVHNFQNPICTAPFCHSLPHAFLTLCACQICDAINSHLLQMFRFANVKLKIMLVLNFGCFCYMLLEIRFVHGNQVPLKMNVHLEFVNLSMAVRHCQQLTFVTLNKFCPLSKNPSTTLFLIDIKMDRISTKIKWKIYARFTFYFKFWRYFL